MIREPGTYWDYENYDTLRAVYAMKRALGDERTYHEFPRRALFDRIGMRNTLVSMDRFGDFILSSQVYTNARDLARFGLLYLNGGVWGGERIISEDWIEFVRTPAPALAELGNYYGGQFWLVPDDRKDEVPADAYSDIGQPRAVHVDRAVPRPRNRQARPGLRRTGFRPLGTAARGAGRV